MPAIPLINIAPLLEHEGDIAGVAAELGRACAEQGFFYLCGHGVSPRLEDRLERLSREFFAQPLESKLEIAMPRAGRAWRGYFPVGNELTSGKPDHKEGIYFGAEHSDEHPRVLARLPLHGRNLFPVAPHGFREAVLEYMDALTVVAQALLDGLAVSLGLERSFFRSNYTRDPTVLFRIFHYPPLPEDRRREPTDAATMWSVGEHTDYGLLTLLKQDHHGGLQIKSGGGWIDASPIPGALVCNLGDMLERMTGGLFRSTPHRVRNTAPAGRLSFPFFLDPGWDCEVAPILPARLSGSAEPRWDGAQLAALQGTYGEYLLTKVSRVFPDL